MSDITMTKLEPTMTATDELRRMLDEAGVEWDYGITGAASTKFDANGVELTFIGMRDGVTCSTILTPEQAIAATVGNAALEAENAKLRELVKRMHRHIRQTCGECDSWYCSNFDEDNECCVYDTLARELGVEVDE